MSDKVVVTVKAYPNPSKGHRETSCVAGLQVHSQQWIRLHPIPFRLLPDNQQFKKFDIITANITKSSDSRPESHRVDLESIQRIGNIGTQGGSWDERNRLLAPMISESLEELRQLAPHQQTLGLVKVKDLDRLEITPQTSGWSQKELVRLRTRRMFDRDIIDLECPPYKFHYRYRCEGKHCNGHSHQIFDWEVIQTYRKWSREYGIDWEEHFRRKFFDWMSERDLHLFVGTMRTHPTSWTCVGVYYPPKITSKSTPLTLPL